MYIVPKKEEKECVRDDISLKIWFYGVFFTFECSLDEHQLKQRHKFYLQERERKNKKHKRRQSFTLANFKIRTEKETRRKTAQEDKRETSKRVLQIIRERERTKILYRFFRSSFPASVKFQ